MKKMIAAIVLLLAAVIGFSVYQMNEKNTQNELYEEATVFFNEKDYKKAIQLFEEALKHNNIFSGDLVENLTYYSADAYLKLEEFEEAIELCNGMIAQGGKDKIPYVLKAYCLTGMGEGEQAASVYKEGYEKTKDAELLYYLVNQYITMEQYEEALTLIQSSENIKDEEIRQKVAFLEIVVYEKQQEYAKAYEAAVAYCEKYPEDEAGIKEKTFLESRK